MSIKLVIWDLDNTLWQGTLTEGGGKKLRPGVLGVIRELDRRGIVQSIASKNDFAPAKRRLESLGVWDYFLCPQISWGPKSRAVRTILDLLNIKENAALAADDSPFERDEIRSALPKILVWDAADPGDVLLMPEAMPAFVTEDGSRRRLMYRADLMRQEAQREFSGNNEEFLKTLHMRLTVSPVTEEDLERVEELTVRTHQLNSTGYTYSFSELRELMTRPDWIFRVAALEDDYGDSGKVGIMLLKRQEKELVLKLLIVSCRVMSRGVGSALLAYATILAAREGRALLAEFRETEYNRIMYITYKLAGFEEQSEAGDKLLLRYGESEPLTLPDYLDFREA